MDRRQRKTRNLIFSAFSAMLENKSYSSITVQDIINRADVGRSTFYAHFETKDELLKEMCNDIFNHVFSDEIVSEEKHDFSHNTSFLDKLAHILYHLQEKQEHVRGLFKGECGDIFIRSLKEHLYRVFDSRIINSDAVPHDYLLDLSVGSFAETVRWWFERHENYSPEEIILFYSNGINTFARK
ncbi:MAG: TetR/AcrR family transcriptional regulator [Treponema sp.]|nr:TetR/AcrR family transcriptional regulator [Treponema sp.]